MSGAGLPWPVRLPYDSRTPHRAVSNGILRSNSGELMTEFEIFNWVLVGVWAVASFPAWYGVFRPRFLRDVSPRTGDTLPSISIIVPARDEAAAIEEALRRMLSLDYPDYEVIAINDRSTDGTGAIMDRVAAEVGSRLQVVHISELPAGWLGKNHALSLGAKRARGEFLLFTDGDVMFDPQVLRRSMALVEDRTLDHLVLLPETLTSTFLEAALINFFCIMLMAATRFPLVRWKWFKQAYLGVGAFNLLRRTAYDTIGGFQTLQLEIADDLMLGRLVKQHDMNQDVYGGQQSLSVRWQSGGVWSIVRGLEKNAFSGTGYSVVRTLGAVAVLSLLFVGPFVALACGQFTLPVLILSIGNLLLSVGTAWTVGFPVTVGLFFPWAVVVFCFIMLRSMVLTVKQGGVRWRDTFYSLADLRQARRP
jgi:cellulose synthase/poly-beta-1,6-N-acetylglucosamine synthase-like glycosyltransferase